MLDYYDGLFSQPLPEAIKAPRRTRRRPSRAALLAEQPINRCPMHTQKVFDAGQLPLVAKWAAKEVKKLKADAIVACGHSGLLLAGAVSMLSGVPVFAVRKDGEEAVATSSRVSGIALHGRAQRWVWLDDMLCSGGTFRRSTTHVWNAGLIERPIPVACLLYQEYSSRTLRYENYNEDRRFNAQTWHDAIPNFEFEGESTALIAYGNL